MADLFPIVNLKEWVEENRHLLKPPVGNKCVWKDGSYIVMIVGGPNARKDYHLNQTPEFFYQIEGDIVLKLMVDGKPKDVEIKEGEIYLLPPNIPHSPQRAANTVGMVIEIPRAEGMDDGLAWFCENCNAELHRVPFQLKNIETDMPVLFDQYYSNEALRTCKSCAHVMEPPKKG